LKTKKPMSLKWKINLLVFLNITFVLLLVMSSFAIIMVNSRFSETSNQAMSLARTVAALPQLIEAFKEPDPSNLIQPLAEKIRKQSGAKFIVVANGNLIRYSHPNSSLIGKVLEDEDLNKNQKVLSGKEIRSVAAGSLGLTVRAKVPIFNNQHHVIGLVSVGFLVQNIWNQIDIIFLKILLIGIGALLFGTGGAFLLSSHIKKQIFNMEPSEIAYITQEQAAILNSVREGIISINSDGKITTCNSEAQKILGMETIDLVGKDLSQVLPPTRLMEVLDKGVSQKDEPMIIGNTLVITNRLPVSLNGKIIGAVASFRDKMKLDQIDQHLADIGHFVDALRSQRHEFMNKLHLISGLIRLKEYDQVSRLIGEINEDQQGLLNFFMAKIHDPAIVGVFVGKMNRAKELNIQLKVESETPLPDPCPHREIVITLLSNSIENALEAISAKGSSISPGEINVAFNCTANQLVVSVSDNGPGIDPRLGDDIFKDGVSTKGHGRGFGLALMSRLVETIGGHLSIISTPTGATVKACLPIGGTSDE
jgi:two-component system, CitB family, sensor kinase